MQMYTEDLNLIKYHDRLASSNGTKISTECYRMFNCNMHGGKIIIYTFYHGGSFLDDIHAKPMSQDCPLLHIHPTLPSQISDVIWLGYKVNV